MQEACEVLGYTRVTLRKWIGEGCPAQKIDPGKGPTSIEYRIDCGEVMRWREARAVASIEKTMDQMDTEEAKRRKLSAEAALVELELAEQRGEVLRIEPILKRFGETLANVRAKMLAIPSSLAPQLAYSEPAAARVLLDAAVAEALRELSGFRIRTVGGEVPGWDRGGDGAEPASASETDPEPVGGPVPQAKPRGKRGTGAVAHQPG